MQTPLSPQLNLGFLQGHGIVTAFVAAWLMAGPLVPPGLIRRDAILSGTGSSRSTICLLERTEALADTEGALHQLRQGSGLSNDGTLLAQFHNRISPRGGGCGQLPTSQKSRLGIHLWRNHI